MRMVICLQIPAVLNRWKKYFCQLSNIHGINDVRQTEMHAAEPLVPEHSSPEVEIAIKSRKDLNHWVLIKFWQN